MTTERHQHDAASALRAALEVMVYAPLGFGAMLLEDGPSAVERARQELNNARFIGRFTVARGVAEIRNRLDAVTDDVSGDAEPRIESIADASDEPDRVVDEPTGSKTGGGDELDSGDLSPTPGELALPDYDTLPAIDIVAKLETLGVDERDAIGRYETAHRQRRTVLGKLAQLAAQ